jgi:hypothetical protein
MKRELDMHTITILVEALESRRHLSAAPHASTLTPQQQAELNAEAVAAVVASMDDATAAAAIVPPATQPLNSPDTDVLTTLSAPDSLDDLVSNTSAISSSISSTSAISSSALSGVPEISAKSLVPTGASPLGDNNNLLTSLTE